VYITYSLQKAMYLWVGDPAAGWGYWDMYDWHRMRSWYPYPLWALRKVLLARQLPRAALAALVFLAVRGRIRPLVPFVAVCAYFTLVYMLTWAEMRYSGPLRPLLAIILVTAGRVCYESLKRPTLPAEV
jgi:predicted membrane-bound mannosyltransferase